MIEHILKSDILSVIIILNNPNISYYFLHKYVCKFDWLKVFQNINNYKDIIYFLRTNFKMEHLKDEYLFLPSIDGHLKVVNILLEKGMNIHANDDYALKWASYNGHYKVVRLLLEKGADINSKNSHHLRFANFNEHLKVFRLLIEKCGNLHAENFDSLRLACERGDLKVVKLLLEKRTNTHFQRDYALRLASSNGHLRVVRILLEQVTNKCAVKQAISLANKSRCKEIVNLLKQKYKKTSIFKKFLSKLGL